MLLRRFTASTRVIPGLMIIIALFIIALVMTIAAKDNDQPDKPSYTAAGGKKAAAAPKPSEQPGSAEEYTFPEGGRELLPQYRFVALYGTPTSTRMGSLGEQSLDASIARVKKLADAYRPHSKEPIYPAFEVIASVASATPTNDNDYSNELDPQTLRPWVDAAKKAGVYVVLDLQPGREHFLTQAKRYESLLKEPHVGLALDPEWRLTPSQVHLEQIGRVSAAEINSVSDWLARLTMGNHLPQKLFLLHQFRSSMITHRERLNMSHKSLAYVIQMDGNGAQSTKADTWRIITGDAPKGMYFGWKNFYDEDHPMLKASQTMQISPKPWFVSYQ